MLSGPTGRGHWLTPACSPKIGLKPSGVHTLQTKFPLGFFTGATIWRDNPMMAATRPSIFSALRTLSGM